MPTSFGEPISAASTSRLRPEQALLLPTHEDDVELDRLSSPLERSLPSAFQNDLSEYSPEPSRPQDPKPSPRPRPPPISVPLPNTSSTGKAPLTASISENENESDSMGRKSPRRQSKEAGKPTSTALKSQNGSANGSMESHLEMRRKHSALESPTSESQAALLMGREGFSLDDEVPQTPLTPNPNASFFDLPRQDRRNFLLLVLLYFLQGIPMGLAFGSVPFLLKPYLSYGQIGVFSLASYPYSLKLLWSPIVDAVWSPKLGRRKSWILPIQMCSGFGMLYMGSRIKDMMVSAGKSDGSGVWNFTGWWFFLVFLCATQDIAVDGSFHLGLSLAH